MRARAGFAVVGALLLTVSAACGGGSSGAKRATATSTTTESLTTTTAAVSITTTTEIPTTAAPTVAVAAPTTTAAPRTTTTARAPTTTRATAPPATDPVSLRSAELQHELDAFAAGQRVPFSVVAIDLATGARAEHLASRQVLSASLYKLFVAREILRRLYAGTLQRSDPAGDTKHRTVDECLRAMIVVSDNDCGVAGMNMVGKGAQDAGLARDGYVSTRLTSPQRTSAADVALFLQRTRDGTLLGAGSTGPSEELYNLLRQQQVNDRLPTGLPAGTPIAHKTGDRIGWAHDAGVITAPRGELLLAVLSGQWASPCCDADHPGAGEKVAFGAIADLGRRMYALMS